MGSDQLPEEDVRAQLQRVLSSKAFQSARRAGDILRFVVEETLAGRGARLKEYAIGAEALGRGKAFDPKSDPIARVEASRLRARLNLYNATEGAGDAVVITVPKGRYLPEFTPRTRSIESPSAVVETSARRRTPLVLALTGLAGAVLGGMAVLAWPHSSPPVQRTVAQFDAALGAPVEFPNAVGSPLVLSPDGQIMVFSGMGADGVTDLYVRPLDSLAAAKLPGTQGGQTPFFSPDGRWIGFWSDGKLRKTLVDGGGTPATLCDAGDGMGASWGADGFILATLDRSNALWRIPENGGPPVRLALSGAAADNPRWPQILPGARRR